MKLKKIHNLSIIITLVAFNSVAVNASAIDTGISTGNKLGTYFQIASDISELLKTKNIDLAVYESKGSFDNLDALNNNKNIEYAIVQSDVLNFIKESKDQKLNKFAQGINKLIPLHSEEVHILAKKEIKSIHDLQGKIVATGAKGSGTQLTSHIILNQAKVFPLNKLSLTSDKAMSALRSGDIDAMFIVAGSPVPLFKKSGIGSSSHLLAINKKSIKENYMPATIPANTYSWQPIAVNTVSVYSVLMSYDPKGHNCEQSKKIASTIYNNTDWLKKNGHPKWSEISADLGTVKWKQACNHK